MSKEGIREDFIKSQWRRYPGLPEPLLAAPQPMAASQVVAASLVVAASQWIQGRFESLHKGQIHLKGQSPLNVLEGRPMALKPDPHWGLPIPLAALKTGDVVALQCKDHMVEAVYLLSPNLIDEGELPSNSEKDWQIFLEAVRDFFIQKHFVHWKTPYLAPSSGVDAHIDFFKATGVRSKKSFYLPTSPELELKKAIIRGEDRVFEIKSCFRDDDEGSHHRREFTMLEWYRSYEDKWVLLTDIEELLGFLVAKLNMAMTMTPIHPPIQRRPIAELFAQYVGMELSPRTSKHELSDALKKHNLDQSPTDDWDDLFFRLYIHLIEENLGQKGPEAIYHFPATQGSLARNTSEGWADRFELYWRGVELANAYQEQTDPFLMEIRVRSEVQKRLRLGREPHAVDDEFLQLMRRGFPPCAGIAMGLDRLFMVLQGRAQL